MSNILYDFLADSALFHNGYIEDGYSKLTDEELKKILKNYREYVLDNKDLCDELTSKDGELSIQMESFNKFLPDNELLKQMALYMDKVIINDPIFEMTDFSREQSKVMNSYLGFNDISEINRQDLIKSIKYMKDITPMVAGRYVKFRPMSYVHEPPKDIPIYYSQSYFNDVLPKTIMEWFQQHAKVHNLTKSTDGGWVCKYGQELTPGRSIIIDFEGHNGKNSSIYFLFETKILELNDETRMVKFAQTLPNTPPSNQQFEAWVYQSINKSAQNFYNSIFKEVYNASLIGSTYLTTSPFVSKLISRDLSKTHTFESDVANLVLSLDLPVIKNASIEKIMDVRNNDGEAFKNFRVQLRKQVRELRGINDPNSLKYKLENISHELNEVQVYEVNKKFRQVKKDLFIDLGAFIVSLSTTLPTSGLSLLGGVGSLIKGYKDYTTYATKVKENPGYFLWKIKGKNIY